MLLPSTLLSVSVAFYRFLSLDVQLIDGAPGYPSRSDPGRPVFCPLGACTRKWRPQALHPRDALDLSRSLPCIYTLLRSLPHHHVT